MYYLTQVLKRKSTNQNVMLLGLQMVQNQKTAKCTLISYYLDENLNKIDAKEIPNDDLEPIKIDGKYKWLENLGFFGLIDPKEFLEHFGKEKIRSFIRGDCHIGFAIFLLLFIIFMSIAILFLDVNRDLISWIS